MKAFSVGALLCCALVAPGAEPPAAAPAGQPKPAATPSLPNAGTPTISGATNAVREKNLATTQTEEQRRAMTELMKANAEETRALNEKVRLARRELEALVHADKIEEPRIHEKAAQIGQLEGDLAVIRAHNFEKMRPMLTPEQIERYQHPERMNSDRSFKRREDGSNNVQFPRPPQNRPPGAPPGAPAPQK